MQQQEVMTASINPVLLIDIAEKIMQCKEKPITKKRFPVVTAKSVKDVSSLLEQEIVKGRSFCTLEEKWAFEEHLRGHK